MVSEKCVSSELRDCCLFVVKKMKIYIQCTLWQNSDGKESVWGINYIKLVLARQTGHEIMPKTVRESHGIFF